VCTESVDNQGNPISCTSDADCGVEGTCAETEQGNSPKVCTDDTDCDPGDVCLKSPSDVCLLDVCRDFSHTVSESGAATDLGTYDSSIVCIDRVGRCGENLTLSCVTDAICDATSPGDTCDMTPTVVAGCNECTSVQVNVPAPSDVVCTITNTPKCFNVDCDDGVECTIDTCDPATGACSNTPDDTYCDDGLFCNGVETCDPLNDCQAGTSPDCDDGDVCTDDFCDENLDTCVNTPNDLCPMDCLTMKLTLNETDFTPGDQLILVVDFVPNGIPLDLYIQWFAPDGTVLYLDPSGNLAGDPVPYLEDWGPEFLDGEVVLTRNFTDDDPLGVYMVRGIATFPNSSLQVVRSNELSFTLSD
jgi:hypothetical protein